jgi:collagenase-like PrtC family protease
MDYYAENFGIERFKVTGRTHPTPYILWITEEYLKQNYKGNLLQLWADVKNIKRVADGKEDFLNPKFDIDAAGFETDFIKEYENPELKNLDVEYQFLEDRLKLFVKERE